MLFADRADAGRQLAETLLARLPGLADQRPIVLGVPRGGVIIGREVARALGAPLDVIVARKLGAPGHEELGIGAIAPGGITVLDDEAIRWLGITNEQIRRTIDREADEMNRMLLLYRGDQSLPDVRGRTAILVDDGLATGVTARAAVEFLRQQQPERLVVAVPVCSAETVDKLGSQVDEVICTSMPTHFRAVGIWYRDFTQTTDQEVIDLLRRANQGVAAAPLSRCGHAPARDTNAAGAKPCGP